MGFQKVLEIIASCAIMAGANRRCVEYPSPSLGSYDAVGLDGSVCFDRYGRLGAYGYGEGEKPGRTKGWHKPQAVNWNDTNWGQLQKQCVERNKERFDFTPRESDYHVTPERNIEVVTTTKTASQPTPTPGSTTAKPRKRTAVLIRTWTGYEYSKNVMQQIRSMITELSLQTGGEYEVFLMVHVKDNALPIYSDPVLYKTVIRKFVPKEFWDITILWNESMNKVWYPLLELESEYVPIDTPSSCPFFNPILTISPPPESTYRNGCLSNASPTTTPSSTTTGTTRSTRATWGITSTLPTPSMPLRARSPARASGSAMSASTSLAHTARTSPNSAHSSSRKPRTTYGAPRRYRASPHSVRRPRPSSLMATPSSGAWARTPTWSRCCPYSTRSRRTGSSATGCGAITSRRARRAAPPSSASSASASVCSTSCTLKTSAATT